MSLDSCPPHQQLQNQPVGTAAERDGSDSHVVSAAGGVTSSNDAAGPPSGAEANAAAVSPIVSEVPPVTLTAGSSAEAILLEPSHTVTPGTPAATVEPVAAPVIAPSAIAIKSHKAVVAQVEKSQGSMGRINNYLHSFTAGGKGAKAVTTKKGSALTDAQARHLLLAHSKHHACRFARGIMHGDSVPAFAACVLVITTRASCCHVLLVWSGQNSAGWTITESIVCAWSAHCRSSARPPVCVHCPESLLAWLA